MRYHGKVIKKKGGNPFMEEDKRQGSIQNDNGAVEFKKEENKRYDRQEKAVNIPEWNENIQKIIVGYH